MSESDTRTRNKNGTTNPFVLAVGPTVLPGSVIRKRGYVRVPAEDPPAEDPNNVVNLDHFDPPLTHHEFFSLTDSWFQGGNGALFLGYSALYSIRFLDEANVPLSVMRMYFFSWNYFDFIARTFMHVYNITEILRGHRDVKRKLFLECLDMSATLVMGAGTTLSLLANIEVLTGAIAVACSPLASLTPGFCAMVMGLIELVKWYKACQQAKMPVLLRDRLKKYSRIGKTLKEEELGDNHRNELVEEREAMLAQSISIARIAFRDKKITKKELENLLKTLNIQSNLVTLTNLTKPPDDIDTECVTFLKEKQSTIVRSHAFNAGFWLLVGVGVTSAAVVTATTVFCPPLLVIAFVVIGLAVTVKAAELMEIDKRIYNRFAKKENQKTIENDNPLVNFLARRQKEKTIQKEYEAQPEKKLTTVSENKNLSSEVHVKMRIAYELSIHKCAGRGVSEDQFYQQLLRLLWWQRRKYLNRAMEKKIESEALSDSSFGKNRIASKLTQEDKDHCTAQWCRKDYRLFGKPPVKRSSINPLAAEVAAKVSAKT